MMNLEKNKKIVRRYYEKMASTGNVEGIEDIISEDYVEVHGGIESGLGPELAKAHIKGVREALEGLTVTVDRQIAEGDWVVSCVTARGIHRGIWHGMKCTNEPVAFTGVNVDKVVNGKIVQHGGAADLLGPLLAIGAVRVVTDDE